MAWSKGTMPSNRRKSGFNPVKTSPRLVLYLLFKEIKGHKQAVTHTHTNVFKCKPVALQGFILSFVFVVVVDLTHCQELSRNIYHCWFSQFFILSGIAIWIRMACCIFSVPDCSIGWGPCNGPLDRHVQCTWRFRSLDGRPTKTIQQLGKWCKWTLRLFFIIMIVQEGTCCI